MILSTVADRLTAFTARGRPRRAEAALRARAMREISAQLFPRRVCGCFEIPIFTFDLALKLRTRVKVLL